MVRRLPPTEEHHLVRQGFRFLTRDAWPVRVAWLRTALRTVSGIALRIRINVRVRVRSRERTKSNEGKVALGSSFANLLWKLLTAAPTNSRTALKYSSSRWLNNAVHLGRRRSAPSTASLIPITKISAIHRQHHRGQPTRATLFPSQCGRGRRFFVSCMAVGTARPT